MPKGQISATDTENNVNILKDMAEWKPEDGLSISSIWTVS
jgi:hypothetical protein